MTTATEAAIRADERATTADRIAHDIATSACSPECEHPACCAYRYAAHVARAYGVGQRIPTQRLPEPP